MVRMLKNKADLKVILDEIEVLYPNAGCELIYHNIFELLIAVVLKQQINLLMLLLLLYLKSIQMLLC